MNTKRISAYQARELFIGTETVCLVYTAAVKCVSLSAMDDICNNNMDCGEGMYYNPMVSDYSVTTNNGNTLVKFNEGRYYLYRVDGVNFVGWWCNSLLVVYKLVYSAEYVTFKNLNDLVAMYGMKIEKRDYGYCARHSDIDYSFPNISDVKEYVNMFITAHELGFKVAIGCDYSGFTLIYFDDNGLKCSRTFENIAAARDGIVTIICDNRHDIAGDFSAYALFADYTIATADSYLSLKSKLGKPYNVIVIYNGKKAVEIISKWKK